MKKREENLFQIGEVTKQLGVTRKALLGYEELGLLTPARKDEESGYRYYSADDMTQIRWIRALQELGLSLKEIAAYYSGAENMDACLRRLTELRETLDRNIRELELRLARPGDLTVQKTFLPQQICFCRRYECASAAEAAGKLRETYLAAASRGQLAKTVRMFTVRMGQEAEKLDIMCCIPMESRFEGEECVEFPAQDALCIYYRGAYQGLGEAFRALLVYAKENGVEFAGPFRAIYLEGPPNRTNSDDYVTQVVVPVRK